MFQPNPRGLEKDAVMMERQVLKAAWRNSSECEPTADLRHTINTIKY